MEQPLLKRLSWIDFAKGFLILLVIFGHSTNFPIIKSYFGYFYMPMFFFLSGYTLKRRDFCSFLKKKSKSILVPYLIFSILLIAYKQLRLMLFNTPFNIVEGLISIILPYTGRTGGSVYELWFLPCLFIAELLAITILSNKKGISILAVILEIVFIVIGWLFLPYTSLVLAFSYATAFILLGYVCKNRFTDKPITSILIFVISLIIHIAMFVVNSVILDNDIEFSSGFIRNEALWLVGAVTGIIAYCYICKKISSFSPLEYIGKNSLYFYCFHYFVIPIVGIVVERLIKNQILIMLATFVLVTIITTLVVIAYNYLVKKVKKYAGKRTFN